MVVSESSLSNIMGGMEGTTGVRLNTQRHKLRHRFDILKKLGQGTYGKVQLGVNKETEQQVAIKTIKKAKIETEQDLVRIRREIQIMSSVKHPSIIHIYEVFENREKMVLVMEYAAGGELYDYLSDRGVLPETEARRIFRQIAAAIYYCHKHKICHRDLKLENILLDETGNAKIADFGLSNVFDGMNVLTTFCGSPLYASPEIVKGTPYYGPEVDCWSLGVLLYTLVYGAMPFDGSNFKRLVKQISNGDYYEPKKLSPATELIRAMLTVNPGKRANIEDICSHWWVNQGYGESCLEVAEDLANQTPVRLDLLLSLGPTPAGPGPPSGAQAAAAAEKCDESPMECDNAGPKRKLKDTSITDVGARSQEESIKSPREEKKRHRKKSGRMPSEEPCELSVPKVDSTVESVIDSGIGITPTDSLKESTEGASSMEIDLDFSFPKSKSKLAEAAAPVQKELVEEVVATAAAAPPQVPAVEAKEVDKLRGPSPAKEEAPSSSLASKPPVPKPEPSVETNKPSVSPEKMKPKITSPKKHRKPHFSKTCDIGELKSLQEDKVNLIPSPKVSPERSKARQESRKVSPEPPKASSELPKANQELPKPSSELSKAGSELPKARTDLPKESPEPSKESPERSKESPERSKESSERSPDIEDDEDEKLKPMDVKMKIAALVKAEMGEEVPIRSLRTRKSIDVAEMSVKNPESNKFLNRRFSEGRRNSNILKVAEMFDNNSSSNGETKVTDKPRKVVIPGLKVSDAKKAFEAKSADRKSVCVPGFKVSDAKKAFEGSSEEKGKPFVTTLNRRNSYGERRMSSSENQAVLKTNITGQVIVPEKKSPPKPSVAVVTPAPAAESTSKHSNENEEETKPDASDGNGSDGVDLKSATLPRGFKAKSSSSRIPEVVSEAAAKVERKSSPKKKTLKDTESQHESSPEVIPSKPSSLPVKADKESPKPDPIPKMTKEEVVIPQEETKTKQATTLPTEKVPKAAVADTSEAPKSVTERKSSLPRIKSEKKLAQDKPDSETPLMRLPSDKKLNNMPRKSSLPKKPVESHETTVIMSRPPSSKPVVVEIGPNITKPATMVVTSTSVDSSETTTPAPRVRTLRATTSLDGDVEVHGTDNAYLRGPKKEDAPGKGKVDLQVVLPLPPKSQKTEVAFTVAAATPTSRVVETRPVLPREKSITTRSSVERSRATPTRQSDSMERVIPIVLEETQETVRSRVSTPVPEPPPPRKSSEPTIPQREFIIPIELEDGSKFIPPATPPPPAAAPPPQEEWTPTWKSTTSTKSKRLDVDGFPTLQRLSSFGKRPQGLHRLRSSRTLERSDSFSSAGEDDEDDDDGFEILTAESLFSTLLERVRKLTRRLNRDDQGFHPPMPDPPSHYSPSPSESRYSSFSRQDSGSGSHWRHHSSDTDTSESRIPHHRSSDPSGYWTMGRVDPNRRLHRYGRSVTTGEYDRSATPITSRLWREAQDGGGVEPPNLEGLTARLRDRLSLYGTLHQPRTNARSAYSRGMSRPRSIYGMPLDRPPSSGEAKGRDGGHLSTTSEQSRLPKRSQKGIASSLLKRDPLFSKAGDSSSSNSEDMVSSKGEDMPSSKREDKMSLKRKEKREGSLPSSRRESEELGILSRKGEEKMTKKSTGAAKRQDDMESKGRGASINGTELRLPQMYSTNSSENTSKIDGDKGDKRPKPRVNKDLTTLSSLSSEFSNGHSEKMNGNLDFEGNASSFKEDAEIDDRDLAELQELRRKVKTSLSRRNSGKRSMERIDENEKANHSRSPGYASRESPIDADNVMLNGYDDMHERSPFSTRSWELSDKSGSPFSSRTLELMDMPRRHSESNTADFLPRNKVSVGKRPTSMLYYPTSDIGNFDLNPSPSSSSSSRSRRSGLCNIKPNLDLNLNGTIPRTRKFVDGDPDNVRYARVRNLETGTPPPDTPSDSLDSASICSDLDRELSLEDESVSERIRRKSFYSRFNDVPGMRKLRSTDTSIDTSIPTLGEDADSGKSLSRSSSVTRRRSTDSLMGSQESLCSRDSYASRRKRNSVSGLTKDAGRYGNSSIPRRVSYR